MAMKKLFVVTAVLLLSASGVSATPTKQLWTAGWDNFGEPLNYTTSNVQWSVNPTSRKLTITYTLAHATPSKLYQVNVHIFCTTFPSTFGQFPVAGGGGTCQTITKQGVTASVLAVEFGVVTTDLHGNGKFAVVVGPITAGTYNVEFIARDGAGCNLIGGGSDCAADFQSPGPFGTTTAITIP
jgi:hypothetical protein